MIYLEMNHVRKSFGDLEVLKDILKKSDKVLIKGSRGMHTDEISAKIKEYYS